MSACADGKLPLDLAALLDLGRKSAPVAASPPPPPPEKPTPPAAPSPPVHDLWEPRLVPPATAPDVALRRPHESVPETPRVALSPPAGEDAAVRIGVLLPMSGKDGGIGRALLDAAILALFEIGDERLVLVPRDTGGTPEGAHSAISEVLQGGAELVLGPVFSSAVAAVAGPAQEHGVNVIAFSTDRTVAGNGVYLMGFTPDQQVDRIVAFAAGKGIFRYAALAPETPYGERTLEALGASVGRIGGEIVRIERYSPDTTDYTEPVQEIADYHNRHAALLEARRELEGQTDAESLLNLKQLEGLDALGPLDYEALFVPDGGSRVRAVVPLLAYYDVDSKLVQLLGTGLWDDADLVKEPTIHGGWFAGPPPDARRTFAERFERMFGYVPPRIASLAYDATALAAVLVRRNERPLFSDEVLTQPSGFSGADGIFRFRPDGLSERGLAVIEVTPKGLRVIEKAPVTFAPGST
jgi:branched-chain amino acid transport system substrate-binding protein